MKKNSTLASLFSSPASINTNENIEGLSSREQISTFIQTRTGETGSYALPTSYFQKNLKSAQDVVNGLQNEMKSKIQSGDLDMPNFEPNAQKSKSFFKRLEYGTNLQVKMGSTYFPTTSDLGFSLGYKINDDNRLGIGFRSFLEN